MAQHFIALVQYFPAAWVNVPSVFDGGLAVAGAVGVIAGLIARVDPDDPTDLDL